MLPNKSRAPKATKQISMTWKLKAAFFRAKVRAQEKPFMASFKASSQTVDGRLP